MHSVRIAEEPLQAYNLTVADYHTYFIKGEKGTGGVWVHNDCLDALPPNVREAKISGQTVYFFENTKGKTVSYIENPNWKAGGGPKYSEVQIVNGKAVDINIDITSTNSNYALQFSREWRNYYEGNYGASNVTSTTIPPVRMKNVKLAGKSHPETNVPFDLKGFPIFDKYAKFDTKIEHTAFYATNYEGQMSLASKKLAEAIDNGQVRASMFTAEQLTAIRNGKPKVPDYTWHHHQDSGRIQLLNEKLHKQTGHVGGDAMSKGK